MSARERLLDALNGNSTPMEPYESLIDAYAHELAEAITDDSWSRRDRWGRYEREEYEAGMRRAAGLIDPEVSVSKTELFQLPEIKDQASFRPNEQDKKNLRLLMTARRVTSVSDILRWCLAEQAEPVRQRWQDDFDRREAAYDDDVAPDPASDPDLSPEQ